MGTTSIRQTLKEHEARGKRSLSLVSSENLTSDAVRSALASDIAHRYCIPPLPERPPDIWDYPNQSATRSVTSAAQALAAALYGADWADVRPLSGNQAVQIVLTALCAEGDEVWSVPANCGGHFTTRRIAEDRGLILDYLPYDHDRGEINVDAVAAKLKKSRPTVILLDASMHLFPHPVTKLRDLVGDDILISYDASHTFGIIGGGLFQAPLKEGANLLHGSTHKSLWGPQKGMIMGDDRCAAKDRIAETIAPLFVSNIHVHHVAALGIALEELRDFGNAYAIQVLANARALAQAIADGGHWVPFASRNFTDCHHFVVSIGTRDQAKSAADALETAGIFVNAIRIPFDDSYGLRIGTAEITRRGLREEESIKIGDLISRCLDGAAPGPIAEQVADISAAFKDLSFTGTEKTDIAPCVASLA